MKCLNKFVLIAVLVLGGTALAATLDASNQSADCAELTDRSVDLWNVYGGPGVTSLHVLEAMLESGTKAHDALDAAGVDFDALKERIHELYGQN